MYIPVIDWSAKLLNCSSAACRDWSARLRSVTSITTMPTPYNLFVNDNRILVGQPVVSFSWLWWNFTDNLAISDW